MQGYFHQFCGFLYIDFDSKNRRFSATFDIYFGSDLARCYLSIFENILLFEIQTTIIKEWFWYHQLTYRQLQSISMSRANHYEKLQKSITPAQFAMPIIEVILVLGPIFTTISQFKQIISSERLKQSSTIQFITPAYLGSSSIFLKTPGKIDHACRYLLKTARWD